MADLTAVLWTRATGAPRRLATLVVNEAGALSVTYDGGAIKDRLPGLSAMHDLAIRRDVVYPATYANLLPPALAELAPPHHPAGRLNPQRVIVEALAERVYAARAWKPANRQQREWDLLLIGGRGGIGVLDVFSSDERAERWYATPSSASDLLLDRDGVGAAFRSIVASSAMVPIEMVGGGRAAAMPSVGGVMPKALARFDPGTGRVFLDLGGGAVVERPGVPAVVKIEATGYRGIVELEALAYQAAAAAGLRTPRVWTLDPPEFRPMLVVERLDMGANGAAMPLETLFSVLFEASGGRVASADQAPYEMVAAALLNPNVPVAGERAKATETLFRQVLLSLLIGNGDLHLRNMAVLGTRRDGLELSPVYDPAPMRAWDEHDIVSACNLGGLDLDRATAPPQLDAALGHFARSCALSKTAVADAFEQCLAAGARFLEAVKESRVEERRKASLLRRAGQVRAIVEKAAALHG
ncbi:MAG: HipA domain-containing protein [Alphaproteobacteria bacterium]|nr:HipA domain-containing protein [Alphaproteobacteria bacterium]